MDRLDEMYHMQRELQSKINGYEIGEQTDEQRIDNIKMNVLAATAELIEVLDETGWKPWATSRHVNYDRGQQELVDVWHFFMNLMLHFNMQPHHLYERYREKYLVNVRRQEDGYDGVKEKCPQCHRDLAEMNLKEVIVKGLVPGANPHVDIHCMCGAWLGSRAV